MVKCSQPVIDKGLTLFVTMKKDRIFSIAEQMRLKKKDLKGNQRLFSSKLVNEFMNEGVGANFFSSAEILAMTRFEINNLRANIQQFLPVSKIRLFEGQSVVEKLMHKRLIEELYPLHEPDQLKRLAHDWYGGPVNFLSAHRQPLEEIRCYFGEGTAFYFAFLRTLTLSLIFPAAVGVVHYLIEATFYTNLSFCIVYLLWAFALMEFWKRKSNELSYSWGTDATTGLYGEPRANYRGELQHDPVSGQLQPHYPRWRTLAKLYLVSMPLVLLCMVAAFWLMLESFWKEAWLVQWTSTWTDEILVTYVTPVVVALPGLIYAALVWFANQLYRRLATRLTEWENHRTESQFERNRVTKLILFEFVNNFLALFYIAFYLQDIKLLRWQVVMMLMVFQVINQLTETLIPYLNKQWALRPQDTPKGIIEPDIELTNEVKKLKCPLLESDHHLVKQAASEVLLADYEGAHEDYLELFIQFGFVLLFIVTYPLACLGALVNNVFELPVDAFKLTRINRRPPVMRVGHIGAWQPAFRILCSIAVATNCALLFLMFRTVPDASEASEDAEASAGAWHRALVCVSLDHALLVAQMLLGVVVPAFPAWVRIAQAKERRLQRS